MRQPVIFRSLFINVTLKLLIFLIFFSVLPILFFNFLRPAPLVTPIQNHQSKEQEYEISPVSLKKIFSEDHTWTATLSAQSKRILIATGDVIPARDVNIKTTKFNNFNWPYEKTADFLKNADITFINLETPLIKDCPLIDSGFTFCGSDKNIEGLTFAGVDVASLANNHAGNFGQTGVAYTKELLNKNDILATGIDGPTYKDVKGTKFAFLGYNDIGVQSIVSQADLDKIQADIKEAKSKADAVVITFHWGVEYRNQPDERQKYLGHFAIDSGADLVIGNHPHWIQPVEIYKDKLITYAHGNFVFDQEWSLKTKQGVVGKYTFYDKDLIDVEFFPILIENFGQPRFLIDDEKRKILEEMKRESLDLIAHGESGYRF